MQGMFFQKLTLGVAGLTALGIGLAITVAPRIFYAGYGIELGANAALLSELRAPGASLASLGAVIFAGAVRPGMVGVSAALGAIVFLAFATGRIIGIAVDGWPGGGILAALVIEMAMGLLCLLAMQKRGRLTSPRPGIALSQG